MIRADLRAAGIPYEDSTGRVADFHALRHTFITRLARFSVNVKVVQDLARHSTPTLTLERYTHLEVLDRRRALDALPPIPSAGAAETTAAAPGAAEAGVAEKPPQVAAAAGGAEPASVADSIADLLPERASRGISRRDSGLDSGKAGNVIYGHETAKRRKMALPVTTSGEMPEWPNGAVSKPDDQSS
jgi:hypothetical protein